MFFSFAFQLSTIPTTAAYSFGVTQNNTSYGSTVWLTNNGTAFNVGLAPRTASPTYDAATFSTDTTIFIVGSYEFIAGAGNDVVRLWVNPSSANFGAGTAPAATLTLTNTGGTDMSSINGFLLRGAAGSPAGTMDELRMGTTWASVTPSGTASPTITATPATVPALTATQGTPSAGSSFTASGANLTGNITVTAADAVNFAISTNSASGYASSLTLTNNGGTVASTPVFVRLTASNTGTFNSTVNLSGGGAAATNVAVSGTVNPPPSPTIVVAPSSLAAFSTTQPAPSAAQTFTASGSNLTGSLTVTAPTGFEVSTGGGPFASSLTLTPVSGTLASTTVSVRLTGVTAGSFSGNVAVSGGGATAQNVQVTGSVTAVGAPSILPPNNTALAGFTTVRPSPSTNQSIALSGSNLTAPITVTPPPGWQISASNSNNWVQASVVIATNPSGFVSNTSLFIRLAGTNDVPTNYTASSLTLVSGAASNNVLLSGSVTDPPPVLNVSTNALSGLITTQGAPSSVTNFFLSGSNLTNNITVTPPDGWQIAVTNADIFSDVPVTISTNPAGVVSNTAVFVRLAGTNTGSSTVVYNNSPLLVASGTGSTNVLLSGSVIAPPSLTLIVPTPIPGDAEVPARIERPIETTNQAVSVSLVAFAPSLPEDLLFVPQTVVIPAGQTSATFIMRTLPISGPVTYTLYATAEGYQFAQATVVVSNTALAAASLGPGGYRENFQSFTNWSTLPFGWSASYAVPTVRLDQNNIPIVEYRGRFIATSEFTPWGTLANYAKNSYQLDTNYGLVNVFGFQFPDVENTPALLEGDRSSQTVFLRNDFTNTITAIRVSYRGRTTRSAADTNQPPATKNPLYTVSIAVGTNAPVIDGPLSYGTANGDNALRSGQVSGLNIPRNGTFSIDWTAFQQSAVGVSKQIGISEVVVEGISPSITVSPSNGYGDLTTLQGTPSAPAKPFLVVAENLIPFVLTTNAGVVTTNRFSLTNTVPAGSYQISTNNINFTTNPIVVPIPTNGAVTNTFWVRLSGSAPGVFSGDFRVEGGTNGSRTAPLGGTVFVNNALPQVLPSTTNLTGFSTRLAQRSAPRSLFISACNIGSNPVNVSASAGYEISLNSGNNYAPILVIPAGAGGVLNATAVYVRLIGSAVGTVGGTIGITSLGAAPQTVALSGEVLPSQPVINVTPSQLPIYQASPGEFSPAQMVTVGGSSLLSDITITPPLGFQVSTSMNSGFSSSGVTLVRNAGVVASTQVYIRFAPSAPGDYSSNVQLTSTGADTKLVAVSGTVEAVPLIATSPGQLQGFATTQGSFSDPQEIQITGQRLRQPGISITFSSPDWVLFDSSNSTTPLNLPYIIPAAANQTAVANLFVRISTTAAPNPALAGAMILSNGPTLVAVPLAGKVCPRPSVAVTPTSLSGFDTVAGRPSPAKTFVVSGADLLGAVNLAASPGYEISTNGASWSTSIVLATQLPSGGGGGSPTTTAQDNAANYSGGWTNGANGGTGFAPWNITVNQGTGFAGNFIGDPNAAGVTGMGTQAFGLYANPPGSGAFVDVRRDFGAPLADGETFSFQWGLNWDSGGGNKGFNIFAGATQVVNVNMGGFPGDITFNGTNTAIAFGTGPMTWSATYTAPGNLEVTSTGRDGSGGVVFRTNVAVPVAPTTFAFYTSAMEAGDQRQAYFNNLRVGSGGDGCSDAFVPDTVVFVRLAASAPAGNTPGTITASSPGAANGIVNLNGVVWTLSASPSLTFYSAVGYDSDAQRMQVSGANLPTAVRVTPPPGITVRDPGTGITAIGSLGQILTLTGSEVDVFVSSTAPIGAVASPLVFGAGSWSDAATVQLSGRVGAPADNDIFVSTMIERLMFRIPTDAEMADYLSLLTGGATGQGTAAQKSSVIMRMMGFDSTVVSANYQTFEYETSYLPINSVNYTGNWVLPSVAFSPYARLGLVPSETEVRQFVASVAADPTSPLLNIFVPAYWGTYTLTNPYNGVPGSPWFATQAMGTAFVGFFNSPTFQANSSLRAQLLNDAQGFVRWLRDGWFFGVSTGSAGSTEALIGLTGAASPVGGQGAAAAFRSMYARALCRLQPTSNSVPTEKAFQLRMNLAALDYQLWRNWSYSASSPDYSAATVQGLLRAPVITSGATITGTANTALAPFKIPLNQSTAPINLRTYFRLAGASVLPAGLTLSPSGTLSGTPTVSGTFNFAVVAQNMAGDSTQRVFTLTIAPSAASQARKWMSDYGYGSASMASMAADDSDSDRIELTTEYAFGGNPLKQDAALVKTTSSTASTIRLEWLALDLGVTYTIEGSVDFLNWTDNTSSATINNLGTSGIYRRKEALLPLSGDRRFYRLKATFEPGSLD